MTKPQALWFGAKRGCGEELFTEKTIICNHEGTFKFLGIEFTVNHDDITGINYTNKLWSAQRLLNDLSFRSLSLFGKVCVVKTLVLPIFIQIFTVLPTLSEHVLKDIERMFFELFGIKKEIK